jgi:hypothetical protein
MQAGHQMQAPPTWPGNIWSASLLPEAVEIERVFRMTVNEMMPEGPKLATSDRAIRRDMLNYLIKHSAPAGVA